MERIQLDVLIPMVYGLAVVICAIWAKDALTPVAVVGAILVGMYFAVFRTSRLRAEGGGRERNRQRTRDR